LRGPHRPRPQRGGRRNPRAAGHVDRRGRRPGRVGRAGDDRGLGDRGRRRAHPTRTTVRPSPQAAPARRLRAIRLRSVRGVGVIVLLIAWSLLGVAGVAWALLPSSASPGERRAARVPIAVRGTQTAVAVIAGLLVMAVSGWVVPGAVVA